MEDTLILEEFYKELDPKKRWEILEGLAETEEKSLAKELFLRRHPDENFKNDLYLRDFLGFQLYAKQGTWFPELNARKIKKTYQEMGYDVVKAAGEVAEQIFYLEIKNAASRYFETTAHEGQGRRLFGMAKPDDEMRLADRLEEAYDMSIGLVIKYDLEEELKTLCKAVIDAYCQTDKDGMQRLDELDATRRPGRKGSPLCVEMCRE